MSKIIHIDRTAMLNWLGSQIKQGLADIQDDGNGQPVVYAGVFLWKDGTYREKPEVEGSEEPPPKRRRGMSFAFPDAVVDWTSAKRLW